MKSSCNIKSLHSESVVSSTDFKHMENEQSCQQDFG